VPVTYNLFRMRRFPNRPAKGDAVVFHHGDPELRGTPAQTEVTFRGAKDDHGLEIYVSKHEILKRVEGRLYNGTEFHEYYKKNEVEMVLKRENSLIACKCSGVVARDLIDELNESYPTSFRADYLQVDFDRIRSQITELNGIWLSQINQPNIDTLALFGLQVDQSQLYAALQSVGHAAAILIKYEVCGNTFPAILSSKGSITFPQPGAADQQLDRALKLYEGLLMAQIIEKDSRRTAKEKRNALRETARASSRRK
jgi:hypothetical protein